MNVLVDVLTDCIVPRRLVWPFGVAVGCAGVVGEFATVGVVGVDVAVACEDDDGVAVTVASVVTLAACGVAGGSAVRAANAALVPPMRQAPRKASATLLLNTWNGLAMNTP